VAIFSVLKGIVLRHLAYQQPERLVAVWETPPDKDWYQPFSSRDYLDVREQARSLEEIGVLRTRWFNLAGQAEPARVVGAACTPSLLKLLGVAPAQGRLFAEDEQVEGNHRVLILSHELWQAQFGGQPDVVGRWISVDGEPYAIVGVMPESFEFPTPWGGRDESRLWAPLLLPREDSARGNHSYGAVARLAEGVTPEKAAVELRGIAVRLAEAHPDTNARVTIRVEPLMRRTLGGIRSALTFLSVVVALVLLVACANVASMLLARGTQRMPELAVRASIGATRGRLVRQLVTESSVLCLLGGLGGLLLAQWAVTGLKAILPGTVPRVAGIRMDPTVLGFAVLVTVATGLFFGLAPALVSSRTNLVSNLAGRPGRAGGRSRNRFLSGFVVAQLAIGFVLVNAAALLVASYDKVVSQRLNFETEKTLVAGISVSGPAYEEPQPRLAFFQQLRERLRALPGVVAVGLTTKLPLRGGSNDSVLVRDQVFDPSKERELVEYSFVDDGYHQAMGIGLVAGRLLEQGDLDRASAGAGLDRSPVELPVVVNRTMAERLWPGESAIGKVVRNNEAEESYRARVVGVVEDVRQWGAEREALSEMYFPYTAEVWGPGWAARSKLVVTRGASSPASGRPCVRSTPASPLPTSPPWTRWSISRRATGASRSCWWGCSRSPR
jgi:putative ABC transport system permease protein